MVDSVRETARMEIQKMGRYVLRGGEEVRNGKLYGWTGRDCETCKGHGYHGDGSCRACAGTGEEWGLMPKQPENL